MSGRTPSHSRPEQEIVANRTASIYKQIKQGGGWRLVRCPSIRSLPDLKEGFYYICFYEGSKRRYDSLNKTRSGSVALAHYYTREASLKKSAAGMPDPEVATPALRWTLSDASADYLLKVQANKSAKTYSAYRRTIELLQQSCKKFYLDQITKADLQEDFVATCKKEGMDRSTIRNHFLNCCVFMKKYGFRGICGPKSEWIKVAKKQPVRTYSQEQLDTFFKTCTPGQFLLFQFFLSTGFREQEVSHLPWKNIDLQARMASVKEVRVKGRDEFNFTPKDYEERQIKLPVHVCELLAARRQENPKDFLVFPHESGMPEGHFLRDLKEIAFRAGLNCGHCLGMASGNEVSCSTHAVCEHWKLHRFRKTFATRLLKLANKNLREIQLLLGHSDLSTTEAYLSDELKNTAESDKEIEAAFGGFAR
jgi:integrase/recombinase XerD